MTALAIETAGDGGDTVDVREELQGDQREDLERRSAPPGPPEGVTDATAGDGTAGYGGYGAGGSVDGPQVTMPGPGPVPFPPMPDAAPMPPPAASVPGPDPVSSAALTIAADGSYAARLVQRGEGAWCPERWTLAGPEAYAVALPLDQPEEPDSGVLPLSDGRVLIHRRVDGRHDFSLLYPTGPSPSTGQLPLGAVGSGHLELLPPCPCGEVAYALAVGETSTTVWQVAGGAFGPERVAEVPGRCGGGVWLDGAGRMLALDRSLDGGPVKAVALDLGRGGEVTPLLQIADDSDDRVLLADPDSGLLLIGSDAPGRPLLGWGVLGSTRPVRFPECLRPPGVALVPFAVQPGQVLTPESCAVAFRVEENGMQGNGNGVPGSGRGGGGAGLAEPGRNGVALWRPAQRMIRQIPAPHGWLAGAGHWSRDGSLHLPYATAETPCGIATLRPSDPNGLDPVGGGAGPGSAPVPGSGSDAGGSGAAGVVPAPGTSADDSSAARPVPLHQAAQSGRIAGQ